MFRSAVLSLLLTLSLYAEHPVSLQLLWKHQFEFAGYYMAKEKGFYRDAGLDVTFKEYQLGLDISASVLSGESDFGLDGSELILEAMQGKDLYLITTTFQTSPLVLLSLKRDDLARVGDLKGKKIMLAPNQVAMASLIAMLRTNNVSSSGYTAQAHSFDIQDLINGKTDAMTAYLSNEPFHLIERNISYTIFKPSEHGFDFYDNILFTSKALAQRDPKLVDAFYEASKKGWIYAFEHIHESAEVIHKQYNSQNKSLEHLIFEGETIKTLSGYGTPLFGTFKPAIISQIAQTYKLLDMTQSTPVREGLIYPPSIMQEQIIDYTLIWKLLGLATLILSGLYWWNQKLRHLNAQIRNSKRQVLVLLDNAGQGFLSFGQDFLIEHEFSKACLNYLGAGIDGSDISALLFMQEKERTFFKSTLLCALGEQDERSQKAILSLLPTLVILNKRALRLEYRIIDQTKIMMILTNVSAEKRLEKRIEQEQERLKMVVAVVSESDTFFEAKAECASRFDAPQTMIDPLRTPLSNLSECYRTVHTLKGTFAQLYMTQSVKALHEMEGDISDLLLAQQNSNEALIELLKTHNILHALSSDLDAIRAILGTEFVDSDRFVKIDATQMAALETKIAHLYQSHGPSDPECAALLSFVQDLSSQKLVLLLKPYISLCADLAKKLRKELYPMQLIGDTELSVPKSFKPFIKSLIHLFRNSLDHGIELPEIRLAHNKEESGTIICNFKEDHGMLHLIISDDGAGIDRDTLIAKLHERGVATQALDEAALYAYLFDDRLSTKSEISELSGRGMGLSAVYAQLQKLGGNVHVSTCNNGGTTFEFIIPLKEQA